MKKALHITKVVLVWLLVVLAVCMMIFTVVSSLTFDRTDRDIFGYKAFIVLSDSMSATDFSAGDLVLVKEVDPATLQEGDIIAYQSINTENYGEVVTHKIRERTTDAKGRPGFITYGTTTGENDENVVTYSFVLGKYQTRLPGPVFENDAGLYRLYFLALPGTYFDPGDQQHPLVPPVQEGTAGGACCPAGAAEAGAGPGAGASGGPASGVSKNDGRVVEAEKRAFRKGRCADCAS